MSELVWLGLFLSFGFLVLIARKTLWLSLIVGALILGIFTLPLEKMGYEIFRTLREPSILLLAFGVGLIPLIGGAMEESRLIDVLVENLRVNKKLFLIFTPGMFGMLPMPGGALLSAPLIEKGGEKLSPGRKTAINVWFRHIVVLVYPLGALLATTKMAGINLYKAVFYLIPGFILLFSLGYFFLLKGIKRAINHYTFNFKKLILPFSAVLFAPIFHFFSITLFPRILPEIPLVIGISGSLFIVFFFTHLELKDLKKLFRKTKPWRFSLIIIGMFLFLHIFKASEASKVLAELSFSKIFIIVGGGASLGFITGRVQVPVSIILPIYYAKYGVNSMSSFTFTIMFFSIFMGYMISPVHPCVSVSLEFFNAKLKDFFKVLITPTIISLAVAFLLALIFI